MALYNVKNMKISSVFKTFFVITTIESVIWGVMVFLFIGLSRQISTGTFDFRVTLLASVSSAFFIFVSRLFSTVVVAWIYNFVSAKLGYNVVVSIESAERDGEEADKTL